MVSEALLDPLELSGWIPDFQKAVPHPDPIRGLVGCCGFCGVRIGTLTVISDQKYPAALRNACQAGLKITNKYYSLTDTSPLYRIAILLHPSFRDKYFKLANWEPEWIAEAIRLARDMWISHYKPRPTPSTSTTPTPTPPSSRPITSMLAGLSNAAAAQGGNSLSDAFDSWLSGALVLDGDQPVNPLKWWIQQKRTGNTHGGLVHMALDVLGCPCGGYPQVPAKSTRSTRQAVPGAVSGVWFWGKKHPVPGCERVPGSAGAIPIAYTTGAVCFASMGFQNGRRSPNVLGQRCYSVLQSIGKPFWFPIDRRTTIQLFSQRTWETLRMPSSHRFENHSVFKSLGERQDNTFPERSTTPTVLEATLYIDLLTFGAFKSQRTCSGLPEGSLHCLPPHRPNQTRRGGRTQRTFCEPEAQRSENAGVHPRCSRILRKLQQLVFMKETRSIPSKNPEPKVKDKGVSAFKNDSSGSKTKRPKPANPCDRGKHNPLAYHPAWRCHKSSKEEREALKPKETESHLTKTSILLDDEDEIEYAEVFAYIGDVSVGLNPILDSGASHHMVNDQSVFNKTRDVNINIFTGGVKQQINATAAGEVLVRNNSSTVILLKNVLLVPNLHQPLISMNQLLKG
ncbi:hypothetical protein PCANC_28424 [Puccinia coronata f. sp. avenae]|uniref:Retrovirus-related Pol polyprotein from transposon TNT 1-94-like beta-barrel domain-containing protein n=1 Tax=Puccinia coronata f. sp. avenae TaxID=200324 RepID=A0A2N5THG7_9BASI|nr:hypothetical protein PCANC_28424 [Puccinia coronata f. sp. avenae]